MGESHHLIIPIGVTPVKLVIAPGHTVKGADDVVGAAGGFTEIVIEDLVALVQNTAFHDIII